VKEYKVVNSIETVYLLLINEMGYVDLWTVLSSVILAAEAIFIVRAKHMNKIQKK